MAKEAPLYDLVLLLRQDAEESTRTKILKDVETTITSAGGSVERNDDWGRRPLAYQIRHLPEAEYHLLQFHAPGSLIEDLSHTLRITDGVVRFRVIKVRPGTPDAPTSIPVVATAPTSHSNATAGGAGGSSAGAAASPDGPSAGPASSETDEAARAEAESPDTPDEPESAETPSPGAESAEGPAEP